MFSATMWVYPWDLLDEEVDPVLDRIQEIGATGISVATLYHSIEHLRVHKAMSGKKRAYQHQAAAYFQPDTSKYAKTRLKPTVAEWLKTRNPLTRFAEECRSRDLALRSWTVCSHNSEMVRRLPGTAIKTVFGDVNPTWMCPVNQEVREYLRAVVEDLSTNYPFDTIELESPAFDAGRHYHTHIKVGLASGPVEDFLLGLCFCESCRRGADEAGIDVDELARLVTTELEQWMENLAPSDEPIDDLIRRIPPLRKFLTWRNEQMSETIRKIKSTCACQLMVYAGKDTLRSALDLADLRDDVDAALTACYSKDAEVAPEAIDEAVDWMSKGMGGTDRLSIGLMTYPPAARSSQALSRCVHRVAELGVPSVHLYHYGIMPDPCLTWCKQALRKPRREAD